MWILLVLISFITFTVWHLTHQCMHRPNADYIYHFGRTFLQYYVQYIRLNTFVGKEICLWIWLTLSLFLMQMHHRHDQYLLTHCTCIQDRIESLLSQTWVYQYESLSVKWNIHQLYWTQVVTVRTIYNGEKRGRFYISRSNYSSWSTSVWKVGTSGVPAEVVADFWTFKKYSGGVRW